MHNEVDSWVCFSSKYALNHCMKKCTSYIPSFEFLHCYDNTLSLNQHSNTDTVACYRYYNNMIGNFSFKSLVTDHIFQVSLSFQKSSQNSFSLTNIGQFVCQELLIQNSGLSLFTQNFEPLISQNQFYYRLASLKTTKLLNRFPFDINYLLIKWQTWL